VVALLCQAATVPLPSLEPALAALALALPAKPLQILQIGKPQAAAVKVNILS
jgi:hypothetical protein